MFWWMELYFFSLECNEMSSNELGDVYGFGESSSSLVLRLHCTTFQNRELKGLVEVTQSVAELRVQTKTVEYLV